MPPEIIVAILGVETYYGRNVGNHSVLDALATLAFDYPRRAAFFRGELKQFLLLARELGMSPLAAKGSFAGAMGVLLAKTMRVLGSLSSISIASCRYS